MAINSATQFDIASWQRCRVTSATKLPETFRTHPTTRTMVIATKTAPVADYSDGVGATSDGAADYAGYVDYEQCDDNGRII